MKDEHHEHMKITIINKETTEIIKLSTYEIFFRI